MAKPLPGENWLDVCCGTGKLTIELDRFLGIVGGVTGLDFNTAMLDVAKQAEADAHLPVPIRWLEGDALDLPFPDKTFDGVIDLLTAILPDSTGIGRIVLKGCEASGFVSNETTLALYAAVKEMMPRLSHSVDIVLWGGVSTPEAAAAFLVTGAQGINQGEKPGTLTQGLTIKVHFKTNDIGQIVRRTLNLRITNAALCRLSYVGKLLEKLRLHCD